MDLYVYILLTISYFFLLIWGLLLTRKSGWFRFSNLILLVIVGLIYDNLIISIGRTIGEGSLLETLSALRFWLHALFTPTLILFGWSVCYHFRFPWTKKIYWKVLFFLLTIGLIVYELFSLINLDLKPNWKNGLLTYDSDGQSPIMVIIVTIVLAIIGFLLLRNLRFPWLLIGVIVMVLGSTLNIWLKNFPIMNVLELVLIVSLLRTKQYQLSIAK